MGCGASSDASAADSPSPPEAATAAPELLPRTVSFDQAESSAEEVDASRSADTGLRPPSQEDSANADGGSEADASPLEATTSASSMRSPSVRSERECFDELPGLDDLDDLFDGDDDTDAAIKIQAVQRGRVARRQQQLAKSDRDAGGAAAVDGTESGSGSAERSQRESSPSTPPTESIAVGEDEGKSSMVA
jgi:hypothetical protein|eukprot:COSAG06_NODE_6619_length_2854_cov_1.903811_1_plen_191_part_00